MTSISWKEFRGIQGLGQWARVIVFPDSDIFSTKAILLCLKAALGGRQQYLQGLEAGWGWADHLFPETSDRPELHRLGLII